MGKSPGKKREKNFFLKLDKLAIINTIKAKRIIVLI